MADRVIERAEIVALLFDVADIADAVAEIRELLKNGDDGGEEEEETDRD
jgi:hypothetical protein